MSFIASIIASLTVVAPDAGSSGLLLGLGILCLGVIARLIKNHKN